MRRRAFPEIQCVRVRNPAKPVYAMACRNCWETLAERRANHCRRCQRTLFLKQRRAAERQGRTSPTLSVFVAQLNRQ
jgi:hypothetical protein